MTFEPSQAMMALVLIEIIVALVPLTIWVLWHTDRWRVAVAVYEKAYDWLRRQP